MSKYRVNWERHPGRFHLLEGDVIELSDEDADWIQRDSDGILTRVPDDTPLVDASEVEVLVPAPEVPPTDEVEAPAGAETQAADVPAQDRMVRATKKRERRALDRASDPESGSQGPMTKADWGAKKG